ncbi:hypothetical protein FQZ97_734580 [compost metagenome]
MVLHRTKPAESMLDEVRLSKTDGRKLNALESEIIVKARQHVEIVRKPVLNLVDYQYTMWRLLAGHLRFDMGQQMLKVIDSTPCWQRLFRCAQLLHHRLPPAGITGKGDMGHREHVRHLSL